MNNLLHQNSRRAVAGLLILSMLLLTISGGLLQLLFPNQLFWLAGFAAWGAALFLVSDVSRAQQFQLGLLVGLGLLLMIFAAGEGADIDIENIVSGNTGLLTMVTSVGFLRLVAAPLSGAKTELPVGGRAYLHTLIGTSLFSSVINISAPILIADRLHDHKPLQRFTSQSITRVFSASASWSPFFAAMAVVLTYVSGASLPVIMLVGIPFALVAFALVFVEAAIRYSKDVEEFAGYPLKISSLWIPALLALSVLAGSWLLPSLSILVIIALSALLVTALTLLVRTGAGTTGRQLRDHVMNGLPRSVNELTLFLAAGVLATGIAALLQTTAITLPVAEFGAVEAIVLLGIIILVAAAGVHPVILISGFTPLVLSLDPNPNLLAMTYLFGWSLGTCASPLSGTHLVFQGRYGIPSWKGAVWNWPYVIVMYGLSALWTLFVAEFLK